MRLTTKLAVTAAATLVAVGTTLVGTAPSSTAAGRVTTWAPAATAKITPGVQMYTEGAQCTGNFVFTDSTGGVYVGYAAHCAGLGEATDTNGCLNESVPLGTTVTFNQGGSLISNGTQVGTGTLVYSSWRTMRANGVTDANTCAYNDFALVKVNAGDVGKVNPSIPFWGGPTGIDTNGTAAGDRVWSFGNSSLRAGIDAALAEDRHQPRRRRRRRRLEPPALHRHPGRPRRLGLGLPERRRRRGRHPVDAGPRPAPAVATTSATSPRSSRSPRRTRASPACSSPTAPSRSTAIL